MPRPGQGTFLGASLRHADGGWVFVYSFRPTAEPNARQGVWAWQFTFAVSYEGPLHSGGRQRVGR
jgi:hypothetical protein